MRNVLISISLFMMAYALPNPPSGAPKALQTAVVTIPGTTVKFELVRIPVGTITLPDPSQPGASKTVQVKSLWIAKTETTWDAYDVYALGLDRADTKTKRGKDAVSRPSKPYGAPDRGFGHQGYPAISITYYAAQQFCRWLSAKTGHRYRLPTEAEWEYACRAGSAAAGPLDKASLERVAWYWDNAEDTTHPVGQKQPNAWGLHDMLGNVLEWCTGLDGKPITCGGSYNDRAEQVHPGARARQTPSWNATDPQNPKSRWWLSDGSFVGFRVVRED